VSNFVLDTTVTMAWCFADEATSISEAILDRLSNLNDMANVPALWLYEVVNVTELAVRKGRIPEQKAKEFLKSISGLPIGIESPTRSQVLDTVRGLAAQYKLTAYDAAYLELAIHQNLPIATFDQALARAARAAGVGTVER
jgi:predicted nucleic acid-binding protein